MRRRISFAFLIVLMGSILNQSGAQDQESLAHEAGSLSPARARELEAKLAENPSDVPARTQLLGYYFLKRRDNGAAREGHILWLIENAPESPILKSPYASLNPHLEPEAYGKGKAAWQAHVAKQPKNLKILKHAAAYFNLHDRELAVEYLEKAAALDPDNPEWHEELGQNYLLKMNTNSMKEQTSAAQKAFEEFQKAHDLSTPQGRELLYIELAKSAYSAEKFDKAKEYAEKCLTVGDDDWNAGNLIHHGNLILGRIALRDGDIEKAKSRLLDAGRTKGSPQLDSFGPNMALAKELLEKNEREVVIQYFELCGKFWKMNRGKLQQWTEAVKANKTPDFRANLIY